MSDGAGEGGGAAAAGGGADGGAGAAAGGMADFLGGGAGAGTGGEGGGGGGADGGGAAAAAAAGAGADDATWLEHFSAAAEGDDNSNRDWLKAKGFKDIDAVAKSLRSAEREITTLKDGGGLKVPGDGASPEEVSAWRQAIGVPEKADGYEFKAGEGVQLDEGMTSRLREAAFKAGVPKGAFDALASDYIQMQLDDIATANRQQDEVAQAKLAQWGPQRAQKEAAVNSAMRALGLSSDDASKLRLSLGADRALDLMAKIGEGMAEDFMTGGTGQRFGITAAEAQAEVDKLKVDPEFQKKVMVKNSPERARWDRLTAVLAADLDQKQKNAA